MTLQSLSVPAVALLLLAGAGTERLMLHVPPADARACHVMVVDAANDIPLRLGNWLGADEPLPADCEDDPDQTLIRRRRYLNILTGDVATVLLTYCADARAMIDDQRGDAYARQGWRFCSDQPAKWRLDGETVGGSLRRYVRTGQIGAVTMTLVCVNILPGNAASIEAAASHYMQHYFGAARLQIAIVGEMPAAARDAAVTELLRGYRPVMITIRSGGDQ